MNKNKKIGDKMIYFDSAATTKPLKEVVETYNKMNDEYWFNPSSMYKAVSYTHLTLPTNSLV